MISFCVTKRLRYRADNRFKLAEFVDEINETAPARLTDGVHMYEQGKVCYLTKNSPFSVHVEIDDFLHDPISGDIIRNTFEYHDMNNKKRLNLIQNYFILQPCPEQPECRFVCSNIHEIVFLTDDQNEGQNHKGNHYKSVVIPMHNSLVTKAEESNNNSYVHIRVPVVLGEYKLRYVWKKMLRLRKKL